MPVSIHPQFSFSPDTFLLFIASSATIREALHILLIRHRGRVLYICGNYPEILPSLIVDTDRFQVRRALTAYQVLSILEESDEPLTLFEHDRSLYDDNEDLLNPIGERCRQRASYTGSVLLFAVKPDRWLNQIEPYANRVALIMQPDPVSVKSEKIASSKQRTLEGL